MNKLLQLDYSNVIELLPNHLLHESYERAKEAHSTLFSRSGKGNDFLGWIDLPESAREQAPRIMDIAVEMKETSDVLIVIGIGGSYLGAHAVIDACIPPFKNTQPEIIYAGHHLSGVYLSRMLEYLQGKRVCINVISKSGTTTEPAVAFRIVKQWMEKTYGKADASKRIIATTDASHGALRDLAKREGYRSFVIPDDVGGRYSVLTPVGLLPIAAAGINIEELLEGAQGMKDRAYSSEMESNPALAYAVIRDALYLSEKKVEVLSAFHPELFFLAEWWKQLFGESEGKDGKGVFPATVINTTDLHSMGQYIQDGARMLFETFLTVSETSADLIVPETADDVDGLNYLAGNTISHINKQAYAATALAHLAGGVPNMTISIPNLTPRAIGELIYFFETAVALSGYSLDVNPFDQPGVEEYKRNMFALLKKPGYEREHQEITALLRRSERFSSE